MASQIYRATVSCTTTHPDTGVVVRLRRGEVRAATDPLVRARPGVFEPVTLEGEQPIEQATKRPGEKRSTPRPKT